MSNTTGSITDDSNTQTRSAPVQRLDGPEALLTAEWRAFDPSRLSPDETADPDATAPSGRAMPPPPSQRRAQVAVAARTGQAGPHRVSTLPSRQQGVTVPRPLQPMHVAPAIVINDPGATLPPRDQRDADAGELPDAFASRSRPARRRPPFVVLGAAVGCTFAYAVWSALLRPPAADAAPAQPLPPFLQEGVTATGTSTTVTSASAPSPSSTLPPGLAATLAQALPSVTSEASSKVGDAGAPLAPPTKLEPSSPPATSLPAPPTESVSSDTLRRAEALRAALEAKRNHPEPPSSSSGSKPPAAAPAPISAVHVAPELVTKWPSDPPPRRPRRRPEAPPHVAPLPPAAASSIRPVTTYTYREQALFAVVTAPMRVTDLVLERGEALVSQPTPGDAARWVISVVPGESQTHVFVKPLRRDLKTNLTLTTNRRSYFLELSTRDDGSYMAAVAWDYPGDEAARRREALARAERERQSTTAISDLQALRFDYRIDVTAGSAPWKPTMAFDDGQKTFIRFARPVPTSVIPLVFVLRSGSTKDATFVNFRVKSDLYVLDRIVDVAELRLATSDGEQDVVRITRLHR